jgi:membrane protease YdiL (CAAX protease family)
MDGRTRLEGHPLATFVALAYVISWSCWLGWGVLSGPALAQTLLFVAGGLGPFAAAVVLASRRGDVRGWLASIFRGRVDPQYYLIALVVPVGVVALAAALHATILDSALTLSILPPVTDYPIYLGFVALFGGGLEEPGWRGYLLPEMQRRHSPLVAALVIGVVWAVWHLPLFLLPGTVQNDIVPWLYLPNLVGLSVLLTWLTNAADGSVVPAILLHGGANAIANYYPIGGAIGALSANGYGLLTVVVILLAAGVVWRHGPSLDSRRIHVGE